MPALSPGGVKSLWIVGSPQSLSVVCIKHFESKYAIKGRRRTLNWKFNPVHTIHSTEAMKRPSVLCFLISPRREPKKEESFEKDQLQLSQNNDYINDFKNLFEKKSACDFECKINDDTIKLVNENRTAITK